MVTADFIKNAAVVIFCGGSAFAVFSAGCLHERGVLLETIKYPIRRGLEIAKNVNDTICLNLIAFGGILPTIGFPLFIHCGSFIITPPALFIIYVFYGWPR